jgi:Ribosomal protein L32E
MADEKKRLIRVRKNKNASFKRDGAGKKKQLSESWRRPRGLHNKQRRQKKAKGALPTPGYGSPAAVRGMHPSGFYEVRVFTVSELEGLNPEEHAVRIGGTVGNRKRAAIQDQALANGLKILNPKEIATTTEEGDAE